MSNNEFPEWSEDPKPGPVEFPSAGQPKRNKAFGWLLVGAVGFLIVVMGAGKFKNFTAAVDDSNFDSWFSEQPINAEIIKNHPGTRGLFMAHFRRYAAQYSDVVQAKRESQIELQQIFNVNYMIDYLWTFSDRGIRDFLEAQYALLRTIVEKGNPDNLCENFLKNSAYYAQVRALVGDDVYLRYINASERLFMSGIGGTPYPYKPNTPELADRVRDATSRYSGILSLTMSGMPRQMARTVRADMSPHQNCRNALYAYYAQLELDDSNLSVLWRSSLEGDREYLLEARRLRGSE